MLKLTINNILFSIWFILFFILSMQTFSGKYGTKLFYPWLWFLINTLPIMVIYLKKKVLLQAKIIK